MKHCLIALSSLLVAASSFGQATFQLTNRSGAAVDAPIFYLTVGTKADGPDFMAALYAGPAGAAASDLKQVGAALPLRSGAGAGYINITGADTTRAIPGTDAGGSAVVQLRAWKGAGSTYETAAEKGFSAPLTLAGGGGLTPPALMQGLTSFTIVPEPGVAALGLLGAGLLAIRRKK